MFRLTDASAVQHHVVAYTHGRIHTDAYRRTYTDDRIHTDIPEDGGSADSEEHREGDKEDDPQLPHNTLQLVCNSDEN